MDVGEAHAAVVKKKKRNKRTKNKKNKFGFQIFHKIVIKPILNFVYLTPLPKVISS
jgi:hypothetical protein